MNNSSMKKKAVRFQVLAMAVLFMGMAMTSGCEPLRKKFTRKKKKDQQTTELIPVLDPIDYPSKMQTSGDFYQHHYALWHVWHKDLVTELKENGSDKKIKYLLNRMLVQFEEMDKVLAGEPKELLGKYTAKVQAIQEEMENPPSIRNNYGIKRKVDLIGKHVRQNLKPEKIEESLVK